MDRKKILIIDDERDFSEVVKLNLESTGKYEVHIENDASNALFTALQCLPDLILLDVIMASKEGPDVAIEIKEDPRLKDTPIVFLTATVTQQEVDREGGKIGGQLFVAKPSSLDILLDSIEKNMMSV
ncbi:MAG: response regulator [Candidatus Omnitrophica bacterium]|nr:response regulator [Candidatus Omnitrophota bacterium]